MTLKFKRNLPNLLRSGLGAIAFRGATIALGILSVTLIAPFLGNVDLGRFAVLQAAIMWAGVVSFGLPDACSGILTKFHRRGAHSTAKIYLDNSFVAIGLIAAGGAVVTLLSAATISTLDGVEAVLVLPFAVGMTLALLSSPFGLAQAPLNADGAIERGTAWALINSAVTLASLWIVIHLKALAATDRLLLVTITTGLATLITRIAMYSVETHRLYGSTWPRNWLPRRRLSALLRFAYPFVVINIAALTAFQIDRFVSYRYLSPGDTAKLDVTLKVLMAVHALFSVLVGRLWHSIGHAWNAGDGVGARTLMLRAVSWAALFWFTVAVLLIPTIDPIVQIFTRGTVRLDDTLFVVAALAYITGRGIVDTITISIFATRHQHKTLRAVIAHGVLNVPCSIAGCLAFGLTGIMLGQLVSLMLTTGYRFPVIFWRATEGRA